MNHTENATQRAAPSPNTSDTQVLWNDVVIVNVSLTVVQISVFVVGMIWANHYVKKREERDRKEQREREERDKIAEILSSEYNKIESENIPEKISKTKTVFKNMPIFHAPDSEPITSLDVLRYMCREDKCQHYKTPMLEKLHRELGAIWKLFLSFRIKLPPNGVCPSNIKEELGPLISDLGKTAASFITGTKRETIETVLKYFGQSLDSIEDGEQSLDAAIPYIKELRLGPEAGKPTSGTLTASLMASNICECATYEDAKWTPNITGYNPIATLTALRDKLKSGERIEGLQGLVEDIRGLWQDIASLQRFPPDFDLQDEKILRANMLHAVRTFVHLLHHGEGPDDIRKCPRFRGLIVRMEAASCVTVSDGRRAMSKCKIQDIKMMLERLETIYSDLLKDEDTVNVLEKTETELRKFMMKRLHHGAPPSVPASRQGQQTSIPAGGEDEAPV